MLTASLWQRFTPRIRRTKCNTFSSPLRFSSSLSHGSSATSHDSTAANPSGVPSVDFDNSFSSTGVLCLQRMATAIAGMQEPSLWPYVTVAGMASSLDRRTVPWHPDLLTDPDSIRTLCGSITKAARTKWFEESLPENERRGRHSATELDTRNRNGPISNPRPSSLLSHSSMTGQLEKDTQDRAAADCSSQASDSEGLSGQLPGPPHPHVRTLTPSSLYNGPSTSNSFRVAQPHVIALIDGDGYIFSEEMILKGRDGGIEAATRIAESVAKSFDYRQDFRLSIYLFMNKRGLLGMLVGSDRQYKYDLINEFLCGFQTPPFNYVIDPGPGKERVDAKLKELMRVSLRAPDTECVILGVGHDSGYIPNIEGEVLYKDKIKLLIGDKLHDGYKRELPLLPTLAVPGLFEWRYFNRAHERVSGEDRPKTRDGPSRYKGATINGNESRGREVDARKRLIVTEDSEKLATDKEADKEVTRTVRKWVAKKDPKDRKASAVKGLTPRGACKKAWIAEHPEGTEGQFQAYWETEGQLLYRDWKPSSFAVK